MTPLDALAEVMRAVETFCSHGVPESQCPMPIGCVEYGYPDYPALARACLRAIGEGKVLTPEVIMLAVDVAAEHYDYDPPPEFMRIMAKAILRTFREAGE